MKKANNQVVSRKRVNDHGEVLTSEREVNAMLNLVRRETERIDSRFLEPACGTGNFLSEILKRKFEIVEKRYKKNQNEFELYSLLAVGSIYGVDILKDNVEACRERLFEIFNKNYTSIYKKKSKESLRNAIHFILKRNILWGDALSLKTPDNKAEPIIFSEWSIVKGGMVKRRDYMFSFLLEKSFQMRFFNDENESTYIPEPVQEFPLIHFQKLGAL